MRSHRSQLSKAGPWVVLLAVIGSAATADDSTAVHDPAFQLAGTIDEQIAARWKLETVTPAPRSDDAEFMRRTYLNIIGRIPSVSEARDFLSDSAPDKRARLLDELLESPAYIAHFATVWRTLLVPEARGNLQARAFVPSFENWLHERLSDNASFDQITRELLTGSLQPPSVGSELDNLLPSPLAFYQAKEFKPENLASGASRLLLGVRLECAQCHDHPFAKWRREEFWQFAAFFAGVRRTDARRDNQPQPVDQNAEFLNELAIPDADQTVQASFLDGSAPDWDTGRTTREVFADWLTGADNPYFSRAAVNRIWAHFMVTGLVDPVDDFDESNPPSHPELLDELAAQFAAQGYDVKLLIRAIVLSQTYQLSSRQTDESQSDRRLFARMTVKGLTPEQLFDSLAQATGYYEGVTSRNQFFVRNDTPRARFRELFGGQSDDLAEAQRSILQALALMNGEFVTTATSLENSEALAAIIDAPFYNTSARIEALYLAALSRVPTSNELDRLVDYVDSGRAQADNRQALSDVLWALLNSSEFLLNH